MIYYDIKTMMDLNIEVNINSENVEITYTDLAVDLIILTTKLPVMWFDNGKIAQIVIDDFDRIIFLSSRMILSIQAPLFITKQEKLRTFCRTNYIFIK